MKRTILIVTILASLGVLLLFPTAAFPFEGSEGEVDPAEEIDGVKMSPVDGPNGVYAELDDQEQIRLNLTEENQEMAGTGINGDSVTQINEIFEIGYVGEESATIWITDDAKDVEFYQGTDPTDSLEGRSNNVTLASNESILVGILVDTTDPDHDVEESDQFTVHGLVEDDETPENPGETPDDDPEDDPADDPRETPTPTPGETPTPTPTPEETSTPTPTPEDTPDDTSENTDNSSDDPTETPTPTPDETGGDVNEQDTDGGSNFEEGEPGAIFDNAGLGETLAGTLSSSLLLLLLALLLGAGTFYAVRKLTEEDS